jgi:N-acetyl-anhydromuramyl-L-alanine amidase AmpD
MALNQLVQMPEFGRFLAAAVPSAQTAVQAPPAASPGGDPSRQRLFESCRSTFALELLSPLLAFCDGCRAALAARTASGIQAPQRSLRWRRLVPVALAIGAFLGGGWLGWRLLEPMLRKPEQQLLEGLWWQPLPPAPPRPVPSSAAGSDAPNRPLPPVQPRAAGSVAMACLSGGSAEIAAPADPSNYDRRDSVNWRGEPVPNRPQLIVLHETVVDERSTLALFQRRHSDDASQVSYHVLIGRDGRRIRVVDDSQRAFGAGDSAFGALTVQLKPDVPASVNNIALHVSLVSPADGADGEGREHSGYSEAQYRSLATQIALWQNLYGIGNDHVVTHQQVDRSGTRRDPRSLDWRTLSSSLQQRLLACGGARAQLP